MAKKQSKDIELFIYRYTSDTAAASDFYLALDQADLEKRQAELAGKKDGKLRLETCKLVIEEWQMKNLSARFLGSRTSIAKKISSRENGKKGGRPKKN